MDPRSSATPEVLAQQFDLSRQMFKQVMRSRRVLVEIKGVQKQLTAVSEKIADANSELKQSVAQMQTAIAAILSGSGKPAQADGLEDAQSGMAAALRVVEGGDRATPSQAMRLYEESEQVATLRLNDWDQLKARQLAQLNDRLKQANQGQILLRDTQP